MRFGVLAFLATLKSCLIWQHCTEALSLSLSLCLSLWLQFQVWQHHIFNIDVIVEIEKRNILNIVL
jgi:hypothetical protein